MNDRRRILDLFDEQKDFVNAKVNDGIERYRKGNARITVKDEKGAPIKNTKILICQKTHEFRFGANLFLLDELETAEKNEKYKKYFSDIFNMATLPFYWNAIEPERGLTRYGKDSPKIYRRPTPDLCIEFCEKHGIEPREHALAYDAFYPSWLWNASIDEVKRELERRYSEIAERYAEKIHTIEVTNETEIDRDRVKTGKTSFYFDPDYVRWCFKLAEKYFPNNQLGINERVGLAWGEDCCENDQYYSYIAENLHKGARIDAIGMQYHLHVAKDGEVEYEKTRKTLNPKLLYDHMDMYSRFGKPLQITEITIPSHSWEDEDEEMQAEIVEKLYSIWFSHPNVEQIIYWNLVDGYAHVWSSDPKVIADSQGNMALGENRNYGGLLRFDLTPKPAYYKIKELLQERWHTELECTTDENGILDFRGFFGEYALEIRGNGKRITRKFDLSSKRENTDTIVF